jgi:carbon monoxide dehydrogenase subunit G
MAHELVRTIPTRWDPQSVFDYLLDFGNAEEWDAGTVSCTRTSGDGGVGTHYRNVSEFRGRETELDYVVETIDPGRRFVITGTNKTVTSKDTVTVRPTGGGSEVEYRAEMTFKGLASLASPFLAKPLQQLADDTETKLSQALEQRAGQGRA